jgi:hypothetical protein
VVEALRNSMLGTGIQDRRALGDRGLCSFDFPALSKVRSPLSLHHESAGAPRQRDKEGAATLARRLDHLANKFYLPGTEGWVTGGESSFQRTALCTSSRFP